MHPEGDAPREPDQLEPAPGGSRPARAGRQAPTVPHDPARTVEELRAALRAGVPDEAHVRTRLAQALVDAGASVEEIDEAFAAAAMAGGDDIQLVRVWKDVPRSADDVPFLERLDALQVESPLPLPGVLRILLSDGLESAAGQRHAQAVTRFLAGDVASAIRRGWDAYTSLRPLERDDADVIGRAPIQMLQLFFLANPLRPVRIEEAAAEGLELDEDAVRWWLEEFLRPDLPEPDDREFRTEVQRELAAVDDPRLAHQTRAVRERRLLLRDLRTGEVCVPFDGVLNFGRAVYSFGTKELAWFISAGAGFRAMFVALPRSGALLEFGGFERLRSAQPMANMFANLLKRVARRRDAYAAAIASPPDPEARRKVVLQVSVAENFAHHVWNFHPGLERIIDLGLAANIDEIRTAGTEFFGPLTELFPELAGARVVDEPRSGVRDPYPFSRDHLVVALGGYFIRRSLVRRIRSRVAQLPPTAGLPEPPAGDGAARPGYPVVWLGLRVRSRSWADQEHEVPRFIDALHERYPDAFIVLDGYSYPLGRDLISDQWRASIDELAELTRGIRARVAHPDRVLDLVGSTLRDAVLWAAAADVYIAPNGTSQHKVGWFSEAPGIVYGPHSLARFRREGRPGARESEGSAIPVTIFGEPADAGERRWATDVREHLDNIHIDREELLTMVTDLLEGREPSDQGVGGADAERS